VRVIGHQNHIQLFCALRVGPRARACFALR
jgi:hypothetical protein